MLNHIVLQGRLTREPELRYTQNNTPVATYTLAVERYKSKDGNSITDFIPCVAWKSRADFATKHLHKGTLIAVEGQLQSRKWQDKDGNNRTAYEVNVHTHHFCEGKRGDYAPHPADAMPPDGEDFEEITGDVPF